MEQIVLAGASFIFGLEEIREAFLSIGIEVLFAEVPYMLKYQKIPEKEKIEFTEKISENKIVVPLSEYWISECIKSNNCRISKNALLASRSKKKLYSLLSNFKVPKIFQGYWCFVSLKLNLGCLVSPKIFGRPFRFLDFSVHKFYQNMQNLNFLT